MWRKSDRLIKRAAKGDQTAAIELLRMFYSRIFAYLRRHCFNNEDAEDLTQETFAKAWLSPPEYKDHLRFSAWLHRIAYHVYVDWQRKRKDTVQRDDYWWESLPSAQTSQFQTAAEREDAQTLWKAVEQLDEDKKETIQLHYYQELSIRETAQVLDVATSTVKYRLREALKLLRQAMEKRDIQVGRQEFHSGEEVKIP